VSQPSSRTAVLLRKALRGSPEDEDPRLEAAAEPGSAGGGSARYGMVAARLLRLTSLRVRLFAVFGVVALTAAVSASGIAYWLNRDAVLGRAQVAALNAFRDSLQDNIASIPLHPPCETLEKTAQKIAHSSSQGYQIVLIDTTPDGDRCAQGSDLDAFSMEWVPQRLVDAVNKPRPLGANNRYPYHLYWQRIDRGGHPYLVGGTKVIGGGPTGYMLESLDPERDDLDSLAWSLGIATALALVGAALLAQAASATVLRPVARLGEAARRLGEGKLDTRLRVSGADELADLSRTFNHAAEALQKRVGELSSRESASRRFVADMSHELRTPLTAMTAVTEVLEDEAETLDPMIAPAVRLVVNETKRLNDLVENLMEVTRFDAGTAKLVRDDVDVADMVTACIDARAWLDAVDLDAPRGIVVRLDPRRLDVILANLIGNALKHGGSPVKVTVRTQRDPGTDEQVLVVMVSDSGPGIPEDVLPHVFDRFYKADASRARSEGSGLGLSIAMENAHIHGGVISAANSPEGGAVFTLRLPIDDEEHEHDPGAGNTDEGPGGGGLGQGGLGQGGLGQGEGNDQR
jgi:two-component system, OmpR family, sensor histidine kinase MtrB